VLGDPWLRYREFRRNLTDREGTARESFDNAPARRIGEGGENRIEVWTVNHLVI
jgi:hypothetical protein